MEGNELYDLEPYFIKSFPLTIREGLLCWYPFFKGASVIDESGELSRGIFTDLFKRRGLSIIGSGKADYIIAVDPIDFGIEKLCEWRNALNKGGRLLIAYENPFALRYWAGKRSYETGIPYDTLRGNTVLPSKAELDRRLNRAGFNGLKSYYPLTDHWFAREIYSDDYFPGRWFGHRLKIYTDLDYHLEFDEYPLYKEIIDGGAFKFMCGAYLVEARLDEGDLPCRVEYAAVTAYRKPSKRFATIVNNDCTVQKVALSQQARESLERLANNHAELTSLGIPVLSMRLDGDSVFMKRIGLPLLLDYWVNKFEKNELDEEILFRHYDKIRNAIYSASQTGKCFWELVPANCFYDEQTDNLLFFDQEFYWENADKDIALTRAILGLKYPEALRSKAESEIDNIIEKLKKRYGLVEKWNEFVKVVNESINIEVFNDNGDFNSNMINRSVEAHKYVRERLVEHAAQRAAERAAERVKAQGFLRPAIYGIGKRGKRLYYVMSKYLHWPPVCVIDRNSKYSSIDDVPEELMPDCIIVSILEGGKEIVKDLKNKTRIPVFLYE